MRAKKSRRLSGAERRACISRAALEEFARSGYGGVSMNDIAARAGITKPVLYDHFPSKLSMYGALLENIRDELLSQGAAIAKLPIRREKRFRAAVEAFFRYAERQPDAIRVLLQMPQTDVAAARMWKRVQRGATVGIAALLGIIWREKGRRTSAQSDNDARGRLAAAEFVKAGMHALAEWWIATPDLTPAELVDVVMQVAWIGLGDRADARRAVETPGIE